jgi:hypothetical protein
MKKQHAIKKLSSKVHAPCKRPATCSKFNPRSQKFLMLCPSTRSTSMLSELMSLT